MRGRRCDQQCHQECHAAAAPDIYVAIQQTTLQTASTILCGGLFNLMPRVVERPASELPHCVLLSPHSSRGYSWTMTMDLRQLGRRYGAIFAFIYCGANKRYPRICCGAWHATPTNYLLTLNPRLGSSQQPQRAAGHRPYTQGAPVRQQIRSCSIEAAFSWSGGYRSDRHQGSCFERVDLEVKTSPSELVIFVCASRSTSIPAR